MPLAYRTTRALVQQQRSCWKSWIARFLHYLYKQRHYSDQMAANICRVIKTALSHASREQGLPIGSFYRGLRVPVLPATPIVLLPEQLAFLIHDSGFHQQLPYHLQQSKDLFVFGCSTGLRVGDLMRLTPANIVKQGNSVMLRCPTRKTGSVVHIPLPQYCLDILAKQRKGRYLFRRLCNSNFNLHLKAIGRLAGWCSPTPKYRSVKGVLKEIKTPQGGTWLFYQHLSAHTMRRTAISTLLMMGVNENVVRRISGHAPGSKEFYRYVVLAQSYMDGQVRQAFDKLVNDPGCYHRPQH
jgi:integrase